MSNPCNNLILSLLHASPAHIISARKDVTSLNPTYIPVSIFESLIFTKLLHSTHSTHSSEKDRKSEDGRRTVEEVWLEMSWNSFQFRFTFKNFWEHFSFIDICFGALLYPSSSSEPKRAKERVIRKENEYVMKSVSSIQILWKEYILFFRVEWILYIQRKKMFISRLFNTFLPKNYEVIVTIQHYPRQHKASKKSTLMSISMLYTWLLLPIILSGSIIFGQLLGLIMLISCTHLYR